MTTVRGSWGSKIGFVLAAAGSAVGLGNLWKFPYITWKNSGGAFVIVYIGAVALIGLPVMMSEILVGRRAQQSPVPAFEKIGGTRWTFIGWLGVASGAVIQSYYMVVAGWSLRSFVQCLKWSVNGYTAPPENDFGTFIANGWLQVSLTALFTLATAVIVYRGVGGGIEKATKVMMPVLVCILLYLVCTTLTMEGRGAALSLMFSADFGKMPSMAYLDAVGQAFFSLSLGLGAMIVYGSYIDKKESIFHSALFVVLLDTAVALLACLAMFTIIFSVPGLQDQVSGSTIGMLFITLPKLFYTYMPGGTLLGPLFFVLVAFAALSSTISLGEVVTSLCIDRFGWSRPKATVLTTTAVFLASVLSACSLGAIDPLTSFEFFENKKGVLETLDHLAANWMLPLGGLLTTLFVGWKMRTKDILEELGLERANVAFSIWLFLVRVGAPIAIIILLINVIMGKDLS